MGTGRRIGAGGQFADRVYLNTWYVLGPLPADGASSLDQTYLPERGIDLDGAYEGRNGRVMRWTVQAAGDPLVPQPRAENSVYYALTEIHVDQDQDVWLDIGADDDSKLWLNDELVWTSDDRDKLWYHVPYFKLSGALTNYALTEVSVRVHLHAGPNRLLFKLYNGVDLMLSRGAAAVSRMQCAKQTQSVVQKLRKNSRFAAVDAERRPNASNAIRY